MLNGVIEQQLARYNAISVDEEEAALKEILQELILYGLSTSDFFKYALFHGRTSLRILHQLPRFSEDLDFILLKPNPTFHWQPYLDNVIQTCEEFGIEPEVIDKSAVDKTIQKAFLKDNSIGKLLNLSFHHHARKKLLIKFEIDINPPEGSDTAHQFLNFPLDYSIMSQDLASNFAGKCHALLTRTYVKGRDWFDFSWYINQRVTPNLRFLENALKQQGLWQGQALTITPQWLFNKLSNKIKALDWPMVIADVEPFVRAPTQQSLALWDESFFLDKLTKLKIYWTEQTIKSTS